MNNRVRGAIASGSVDFRLAVFCYFVKNSTRPMNLFRLIQRVAFPIGIILMDQAGYGLGGRKMWTVSSE